MLQGRHVSAIDHMLGSSMEDQLSDRQRGSKAGSPYEASAPDMIPAFEEADARTRARCTFTVHRSGAASSRGMKDLMRPSRGLRLLPALLVLPLVALPAHEADAQNFSRSCSASARRPSLRCHLAVCLRPDRLSLGRCCRRALRENLRRRLRRLLRPPATRRSQDAER